MIRNFAELLGIDHERVRLWTFARAAAEPRGRLEQQRFGGTSPSNFSVSYTHPLDASRLRVFLEISPAFHCEALSDCEQSSDMGLAFFFASLFVSWQCATVFAVATAKSPRFPRAQLIDFQG
jgi:hypothetical protein